jgi:hypothetical protein
MGIFWRRPAAIYVLALALALMGAVFPVLATRAEPSSRPPGRGYWLVGTDGGIFAYGEAPYRGSTGAMPLNQPIVGMAPTPSAGGYWLVATDGGIFSFGDAVFRGSTGAMRLNRPIVGMAPTPSGSGYWLVASDGGIFSFGDAAFRGSTGNLRLNQPIVGMAPTPSGSGYWLVASDGGIFAFGDARFRGSTGAMRLNRPIVGMAPTPSGSGYWLVASDGGIFSFGDAAFYGAAPEHKARPGDDRRVVAMVPTSSGRGYWQVSASGEVLAFGDAPALGGPSSLNRALVGMAALPPSYRPAPQSADKGPSGSGRPQATPDPPSSTTTTTAAPAPPPPAPLRFSIQPNRTWGTGVGEEGKAGRVLAVAEVGRTLYMAGEFVTATPPGSGVRGPATSRPYLAALDVNTGELLPWNPNPNGPVRALAVHGNRLFVGGDFTNIGGYPVRNLAAIDLTSGGVDQSFAAPAPNSGIRALAVHGDRLYLGGNFVEVRAPDGVAHPRPQVAAVSASSGAVLDWFPPGAAHGEFFGQTGERSDAGDGVVYDLAVSRDGSAVHVVGTFLDFAGQDGLLSLDASTGEPLEWQGKMERPVFGIALAPEDGHSFYVATGGPGGRLYHFDPGDDTDPVWEARTDGDAMDVVATSEVVYLLGHYDYIVIDKKSDCYQYCPDGNPFRRHLAAFDARSGRLTDWNPTANTPQGPYHGVLGARHLYVAGDFTEINGQPQPGIAQFPAA